MEETKITCCEECEIDELTEKIASLEEEVENLEKKVEDLVEESRDIIESSIGAVLYASLLYAMITGKTFKALLDEVGIDPNRDIGRFDIEKLVENFIDNFAYELAGSFEKMGVPDAVINDIFLSLEHIKDLRLK